MMAAPAHRSHGTTGGVMATVEDGKRWRGLIERVECIADAAGHNPYDPQLKTSMRAVSTEMGDLRAGLSQAASASDPQNADAPALAHIAVGEAWLALLDHERALAAFDAA